MIKLDKKIKEIIFSKDIRILKYLYFIFNKYLSILSYKKSYSQGSMDLILSIIFKNKLNGIYIDVGCQHPIKNNNTYLLFKKGWKGVNIDLDKANIDLFKFNRPNDYNFTEAVSDKIENLDLFYYHQKSPINTLDKNVSDKQNSKIEKIIKIKTDTLSNVLDKTSINNIDILSIDVEGFELKVLKGLDFNKYIPKVIIVEFLDLEAKKWEIQYNNFDKIINSDLYQFIISKNYKFVNWVNGDLIFILKDFKD
jgi:FkbM family methyltransferase